MAPVREQRGRFVHVIARLNVRLGTGKIMYVNPASFATKSEEAGDPNTLLLVLSKTEAELAKVHPILRFPSCDGPEAQDVALIQEDIPAIDGMRFLKLIHRGKICDTFDGGQSPPVPEAGLAPAPTLAFAAPLANRRRLLLGGTFEGPVPETRGVSYTLQARPHGSTAWQTLAIGRPTPNLEVDVNQFPGATAADIRVLRTNGFSEVVISEGTVDITQ